jgi:hypothetical protein
MWTSHVVEYLYRLHHHGFIRSKDNHAPKKNRTQTVELSTGTIIQSRTWKHYDMSNLVDLHIYIVQKENLNEQHAFHLRRN